MNLKRLFHWGAGLLIGGQAVLALVAMVVFFARAAPHQIDGYGVTPSAATAIVQAAR